LLVAACVVPSSPIFVTLMKEAPGSSETSVLTRAARRNNPENTILHSHSRENLKSYNPRASFSYTVGCLLEVPSVNLYMFHVPPLAPTYENRSRFTDITTLGVLRGSHPPHDANMIATESLRLKSKKETGTRAQQITV
jgi:hypothetical protein